ncbi:MAG: sigma-70 family RNA polymerase sigma factor [Elusimicrobia bacterium]|nr:sigma-70 family RNA polymerase sigma factor [Elusimicrobiota bacterium]
MTPPPESFRALFEENSPKVYRIVFRLVQRTDVAEDLTQQVFLRAHEKLGEFRGDSSIFTWLYRMAMNMAVDHLRHEKALKESSLDAPLRSEEGSATRADLLADQSPRPENQVENDEIARLVRKAVSELDEIYREVIILREMEGLSYDEVANLLGTNVQTVAMRIMRARNQLKIKLKDLPLCF